MRGAVRGCCQRSGGESDEVTEFQFSIGGDYEKQIAKIFERGFHVCMMSLKV